MIKFSKVNVLLTHIDCEQDQLDAIRARFSSVDEKARFKPHGDGIICPISAFGNFATPLILLIMAGAKELFPEETLEVDPELVPIFHPDLSDCNIVDPVCKDFELRYYQRDAVAAMLRYGRGTLIVPTRGGKSLILSTAIRSVFAQRKGFLTVLLVVPNTQLVVQMYDDFRNYGVEEGVEVKMFSSKSKILDIGKNTQTVIISNAQWLREHIDELPNKIDMIFVDECQGATSGSWLSNFVKSFKTNHKFGCTATLSDDKTNYWNGMKLFGPTVYEVPFSELEEQGFVVRPKIVPIDIKFKKKPNLEDFGRERVFDEYGDELASDDEQENRYSIECQFLAQCDPFNDIIIQFIKKANFGNRLALFDRICHGVSVYNKIDIPNSYYIDGKIKLQDRKDIIAKMSKDENIVLSAQVSTMGKGITIGKIGAVYLLSIRSSGTSILQSIGRALKCEEGKTKAIIFDFFSSSLHYSGKHFKQRCALYKSYYGVTITPEDIKTFWI